MTSMACILLPADNLIEHLALLLQAKLAFERLGGAPLAVDVEVFCSVEPLAPAESFGYCTMLRNATIIAVECQACEQTVASGGHGRLVGLRGQVRLNGRHRLNVHRRTFGKHLLIRSDAVAEH